MNESLPVEVCWVGIPDQPPDPAILRDLLAQLSAEERSRAERLRSAAAQRSYLGSHVLLRRVLAERLGVAADRVPIASEPTGRPVVQGMDLAISLSHCEGLGVCAVGKGLASIGVDAEPSSAARHLEEIVANYLTPAEQTSLPDSGEVRRDQLVVLWTAKEAVLKSRGTGLDGLAMVECRTEQGRLLSPPTTTRGEWILTWRLPTRHHVALAGVGVAPSVSPRERSWRSLLS